MKSRALKSKLVLQWMTWVFTALFFLYLLAFFVFRIPVVQNRTVDFIEGWAGRSMGTELRVGAVNFRFFDFFHLKDLYIQDVNQDTFLYVENVFVDYSLSRLIAKGEVEIEGVKLRHAEVYLKDLKDGCTNIDFKDLYDSPDASDTATSEAFAGIGLAFGSARFKVVDLLFVHDKALRGIRETYSIQEADLKLDSSNFYNYFHFGSGSIDGLAVDIQKYADAPYDTLPQCPKKDPNRPRNLVLVTTGNLEVRNSAMDIGNLLHEPLDRDAYPGYAVDFNYLNFSDMYGSVDELYIHGDTVRVEELALSAVLDSVFIIEDLSTSTFVFEPTVLEMTDFLFRTETSEIKDHIKFSYREAGDLGKFVDEVFMDLDLSNSALSIGDLMAIAPKLYSSQALGDIDDEYFAFNGQIRGRVNNLILRNFEAAFGSLVSCGGNLSLRNVTTPEETYVDLTLDYARAHADDIVKYFPNTKWPEGFGDLGRINFDGVFLGLYSDWISTSNIQSEIGSGSFDVHVVPKSKTFQGAVALNDFQLGAFFGLLDVGCVTASVNIRNGYGFELEELDAELKGELDLFEYKNYPYTNGLLDGRLRNRFFAGRFGIKDDNLDLAFIGELDLGDDNPMFQFDSKVNKIDLQALNLSDRPIILEGSFDFDLLGKDVDKLNGRVALDNVVIDDERLLKNHIDSMVFEITSDVDGRKLLSLSSSTFNAEIDGLISLKGLFPSLKRALRISNPNSMMSIGLEASDSVGVLGAQNFAVEIDASRALGLLKTFEPKLDSLDGLVLKGNVSLDSNGFSQSDLRITVEKFQYANYALEDGLFEVSTRDAFRAYWTLDADALMIGNTRLEELSLEVFSNHDSLQYQFNSSEILNGIRDFDLSASTIFTGKNAFRAHVDRSGFLLLDQRWAMVEDNSVLFRPGSLRVDNFVYNSEDGSNIYIQSVTDKSLIGGTVNLDAAFLNDLIDKENMRVSGNMYLNVAVEDLFAKEGYELDLSVDDMQLNKDVYKSLGLNISMLRFGESARISGELLSPNKRVLSIDGAADMNHEEGVKYDIDAGLDELPLSTVEILLGSIVSNTVGIMTSDLHISGVGSRYNLDGDLRLDGKTEFTMLGTELVFDNQVIQFLRDTLRFGAMTVEDGIGHKARINGELTHHNFQDLFLKMSASSTEDFRVMNTTYSPGVPFYGQAYAGVDLRINGPVNSLDVTIDAESRPNTNVVIPISFFTQSRKNYFYEELAGEQSDQRKLSFFEDTAFNPTGIDLSVHLDVTPDAYVTMIFGSNSEDKLEGTGSGDISIGMNRNGKLEMYGVYSVDQGAYNFAAFKDYGISRKFLVNDGGQIVWTGDMLDAEMNIQASYAVRASPYPFVADLITTPAIRELANNVTDVNLYLTLQGSLIRPDLIFDFGFPDLAGPLKSIVLQKNNSLRDNVGEKTIQAASLLAFNSFTQSGQTGLASSVANTAYDVLSGYASSEFTRFIQANLLSNIPWITNFSSSFAVKSLDDRFDEAGSAAGQASGNINYVENTSVIELFDRWQLTYRPRRDQRISSDRVLHDVISEYYLRPDKTLRLSTYLKTAGYQQIGDIRQKFGVGLSFSKSYTSFQDLIPGMRDEPQKLENE